MIQIFDAWVESNKRGEMAAAMMIDLSADFDMVDHNLLLQNC